MQPQWPQTGNVSPNEHIRFLTVCVHCVCVCVFVFASHYRGPSLARAISLTALTSVCCFFVSLENVKVQCGQKQGMKWMRDGWTEGERFNCLHVGRHRYKVLDCSPPLDVGDVKGDVSRPKTVNQTRQWNIWNWSTHKYKHTHTHTFGSMVCSQNHLSSSDWNCKCSLIF